MEFLSERLEDYALISDQSDVNEIASKCIGPKPFAYLFKFSDRDLFIDLLNAIGIDYDEFITKYYYYDPLRKLHVAESEFGYVWISTAGLVARKKNTRNRAVNACLSQYRVIALLLEKAIAVVKDESAYDIDSYDSGLLSDLSPAIFHNLTFYVEVFYKAYLLLSGVDAPHSHKLSAVYQITMQAATDKNHNDSLLQVLILDPLYKLVEHLDNLPTGFKEQYIKYDDNPTDDSVILFELAGLTEMLYVLELSMDFINDYYYAGQDTHYLQPNLYQRLLDRAETDEQKNRIRSMYSHLVKT